MSRAVAIAGHSKKSGHKSHCRACERADYASPQGRAVRATRCGSRSGPEANLNELEKEHRKRVAAARKLHEAQVRNQKKLLLELGVPDLSPEKVTERARAAQGADGHAMAGGPPPGPLGVVLSLRNLI